MILGDWNSRIGSLSSVTGGRVRLKISKNSIVSSQGRQFVKWMNSAEMTIIIGLSLDGSKEKVQEGWTYAGKNGKSIIDHICIDSKYFKLVKKKSE